MIKFFLDESGNTGNIEYKNMKLNTGGQNIFILGAIEENEVLEKYFKELIKKYRLQSEEIKSSHLKNKLNFIHELLNKIKEEKIKVYFELVDKKYQICAQIVNSFVFPTNILLEIINSKNMINLFSIDKIIQAKTVEMAGYLYNTLNNQELDKISKVLNNPNKKEFIECLNLLLNKVKGKNEVIYNHLKKTEDNFYNEKKNENIYYFTGKPDISKKNNKNLNILPNINSLNYILARICSNTYDDILLIHDIQSQFDIILKENLKMAIKSGMYYTDNREIKLKFEDSKNYIGIQIIDVLSGILKNIFIDIDGEKNKDLFKKYLETTSINFVVDKSSLEKKLKKINYLVKHEDINSTIKY